MAINLLLNILKIIIFKDSSVQNILLVTLIYVNDSPRSVSEIENIQYLIIIGA